MDCTGMCRPRTGESDERERDLAEGNASDNGGRACRSLCSLQPAFERRGRSERGNLNSACCLRLAFRTLDFRTAVLVAGGGDVNSRNSVGQTALHKAAFLGYTTAVKTLLKIGVDPSAIDFSGRTALDLARLCNKAGAVRVLALAA